MAAVLLAAAGAGCASHTSVAPEAPGTPHQRPTPDAVTGPYRWLVPTSGPQPTIAQENRHRGTRAWRLPGPSADVGGIAQGSVTGYVAEQAVSPGQTERVYVSAPGASKIRIRIFRIGWYRGSGGREVLLSDRLPVVAQPPCTHRVATGLTECHWHPTLSFVIPPALPSGVYIVKLSTRNGARDCIFVVRSSRPAPLLAQLPTSTYEAYNAWGGDSLYPGGADLVSTTGTNQGVEVSYQRPYDSITGAGEFFARDVAMIRFLERYGYPVSYTTSESVDVDPSQLGGHRAVIDFGHSEYWSARQEAAFAHARDAGTSLLFFSSDTLAWRVRYIRASAAASEAGRPGQTIVAYKEHSLLNPALARGTGTFPDGGAALSGSAYAGCITPRIRRPGPPTYLYYSWAPGPTMAPAWLFAGAGITTRTLIPGIVGYELDELTALSPPGTHVIGGGLAACMRAGRGDRTFGPALNRADTTLYTMGRGAIVFNAGTLGWELGLEPVPSASPDAPRAPEPRVVKMTRNLLARVLRPG